MYDRNEKKDEVYEYTFIEVTECISDDSKWYDIKGINKETNEMISYSDKTFDRILPLANFCHLNIGEYVVEEEDDDRFHNKIFVTKNIKGDRDRYTIDILEMDSIYEYFCHRNEINDDDDNNFESHYDMKNYNFDEYNDPEYPWGIGGY